MLAIAPRSIRGLRGNSFRNVRGNGRVVLCRDFVPNPFSGVWKTGTVEEQQNSKEEGKATRSHWEKRLVRFTPQELYSVVVDVNEYHRFVPWCRRSRVLTKGDRLVAAAAARTAVAADGEKVFFGELTVGFQVFSETYTSEIRAVPSRSVKVRAIESTLFEHLLNEWEFSPGPEKGTSWLQFWVDFRFRNDAYQSVANVFFDQVVSKMVQAFEDQCRQRYQ
mmetsp:Transcript_8183/g.16518  ORF Transcript_8183/g.16518 Transcript_8183/m.16518 type:complete len:221 (-) Transcript_8183:1001-1663(-)